MTDYKNELDVALSEYFTWRGEAIHEVNQTENYKRLLTKLEALLSKRELEAYKKGYIDGGIHTLTNREEK